MVQMVIWLDNTLQIKETANVILDKGDFNFNVVDTPSEMRDIIYKLNDLNNKSRMVAGYCWSGARGWLAPTVGRLAHVP
jgi:hypothetical protein